MGPSNFTEAEKCARQAGHPAHLKTVHDTKLLLPFDLQNAMLHGYAPSSLVSVLPKP